MKKLKISYKDYKVTFDGSTRSLLMYKDEKNQISSIVSVDIKTEKELLEIVKLVLETIEQANKEHLNSAFEKMAAISSIEEMYSPKYYN